MGPQVVSLLVLLVAVLAKDGEKQVPPKSLEDEVDFRESRLQQGEYAVKESSIEVDDIHNDIVATNDIEHTDDLLRRFDVDLAKNSTEVQGTSGNHISAGVHRVGDEVNTFTDLSNTHMAVLIENDLPTEEEERKGTSADETIADGGKGTHEDLAKIAKSIKVRGGSGKVAVEPANAVESAVRQSDVQHGGDLTNLIKTSDIKEYEEDDSPLDKEEMDSNQEISDEDLQNIQSSAQVSAKEVEVELEHDETTNIVLDDLKVESGSGREERMTTSAPPDIMHGDNINTSETEKVTEGFGTDSSGVEQQLETLAKTEAKINEDDDNDDGDDPELQALLEITELQEEETRAAEEDEKDQQADEQILLTLDEVAEERTKQDLQREQAHFSHRNDISASRQSLGLDSRGSSSEEYEEALERVKEEGSTSKTQSSNFFGKKRVGSIRSSSSIASGVTTEAKPSQPVKDSLRINSMERAPEILQKRLENQFHMDSFELDSAPQAQAFAQQGEQSHEDSQKNRLRAYKLSRTVARPVERTLSIYENYKTNLYDVLGLPRDCDDIDVKQAYRSLALEIHPDKNPHPKAKAAFDAIQDAFKTLATPLARSEYDRDFSRKNRLTYKRLRKRVLAFFHNQFSILQLLTHRMINGQSQDIVEEWKEEANQRLTGARELRTHFQVLPSIMDRFMLLHEIVSDNRIFIVQAVALIALL